MQTMATNISINSVASFETVKDQYADGKAARVYNLFIGDIDERIQKYKNFLVGLLKENKCKNILDAACGTGADSIMLVNEGFNVVSVDASDKMLKYAYKARWKNRENPKFNDWVIEEANWETLPEDIETFLPNTQFDAVLCIGNSFPHLLDEFGDQRVQMMCLRNFAKCLKPGGLLFIDHRNFDAMMETGATPRYSIYYNCQHPVDIKTSVMSVRGKPEIITLDYYVDTSKAENIKGISSEFRLCYYPHKLSKFTSMLDDAFDNKAEHHIYGDFQPIDNVAVPAFYIHVIKKEHENK